MFVLGSALIELSRLLTDEQYDGLLLPPQAASAPAQSKAAATVAAVSRGLSH